VIRWIWQRPSRFLIIVLAKMAFGKEHWAPNHARVLSTMFATLSPFARRSSLINFCTHFCAAGLFFATGAAAVVLLEDADFAFALALALAMGSTPASNPGGCCTSHSIFRFLFHSMPFIQILCGNFASGFPIKIEAAARVLDLLSFVKAIPSGK
jgi:hypothetical protein